MVDFWFNHFNVFAGKGQVRVYLNEYERDAIRPHVLGTFRDLLQATAESPAMLFYLDNWQSAAPEGARTAAPRPGEQPDEPAQPESDAGAVRNAIARVSSNRPRTLADLPPGAAEPPRRPQRELRARADGAPHARRRRRLHAEGRPGSRARVHRLDDRQSAAGRRASGSSRGCTTTARRSCSDTRSRLAAARRTASRCSTSWRPSVDGAVSSRPSSRGASSPTSRRRRSSSARPRRFRETGGNIREVVRTIVTSPEFFAPEAYRAKVKTPFEFVVSAVRATGIDMSNAHAARAGGPQPRHAALRLPAADRLLRQGRGLGQHRRAPQPHELRRLADRLEAGARSRRPTAAGSGRAPDPTVTSDALVASALAGELSDTTAATVAKATTPSQALALVLGSPEFQRR